MSSSWGVKILLLQFIRFVDKFSAGTVYEFFVKCSAPELWSRSVEVEGFSMD